MPLPFVESDYGPLPAALAALPRSPDGWPIPFFVGTAPDGTRDLRFADPRLPRRCHRDRLCWICGGALGDVIAFVGGPQSVANSAYTDAGSHPECAHYAAVACPALNGTHKRYRGHDDSVPGIIRPAGLVDAFPDRVAVYCCRNYRTLVAPDDGWTLVFRPGKCCAITWYRAGKPLEK